MLITNQKAYVKNYGEVWFDPEAITNILSLKNVRQKYRVTFDSEGGNSFLIHRPSKCDMRFDMQVKLLRVLQEGVIDPVGSTGHVPVDVRVVAATHRDLEAECAAGRFRAGSAGPGRGRERQAWGPPWSMQWAYLIGSAECDCVEARRAETDGRSLRQRRND